MKQLEKGRGYVFLEPVYGLGLVADIYDTLTPDWYHHYQLVKKGSHDGDVIDYLQLIFIELPKFPVHSQDEKKLRLLWLRFLREINENTHTVSEELLAVPEISEAVELAEESAYSKTELEFYDSYWDQVRREKTLISDKYNEGLAEGLAKGEVKGKAEGLAEGLAKGEVKGKAEGQIQIAKNMLVLNLAVPVIVSATGLTEKEIEQLKVEAGDIG